jgi:hypothetical protein
MKPFLFIILITTVFSAIQGYADDPNIDVVEQLTQLNENLKAVVDRNQVCSSNYEARICSFRAMCQLFNGNEGKEIIYQNGEGQTIANGQLGRIASALGTCHGSLVVQKKKELTERSALQKKKELFERAKVLNITDDFNDILLSLEDLVMKEREKKMVGPSGEKIIGHYDPDTWVSLAENSTNKKLPDSFRKEWISYLKSIGFDEYRERKKSSPMPSHLPYSDNPYIDTGLFLARLENEEFKNDLKKEQGRAQGIFTDVQKKIIITLERRRTTANSKEIDNLVTRVKTVKLSNEAMTEGCPNAHYTSTDHKIHICPQYLKSPTFTLIQLFGHEITHPIGPCGSLNPLSSADSRSYTLDKPYNETFKEILSPVKIHPFEKTISCLQQKKSVWAQSPSTRMTESVQRLEQHLDSIGDDENKSALESHKKSLAYLEEQRCQTENGINQLDESFSDWMASEVIAQSLDEIKSPQEKKLRALEASIGFPSMYCTNLKPPFRQIIQQLKDVYKCPGSVDDLGLLLKKVDKDPHPFSSQRLEKIQLAHPTISNSLGCSANKGVIYCHEK